MIRRDFLNILAGLAATIVAPGRAAHSRDETLRRLGYSTPGFGFDLAERLRDAAAEVGARVLACHPGFGAAAVELVESQRLHECADSLLLASCGQVENDFTTSRVIVVDGWILSLAEAARYVSIAVRTHRSEAGYHDL